MLVFGVDIPLVEMIFVLVIVMFVILVEIIIIVIFLMQNLKKAKELGDSLNELSKDLLEAHMNELSREGTGEKSEIKPRKKI